MSNRVLMLRVVSFGISMVAHAGSLIAETNFGASSLPIPLALTVHTSVPGRFAAKPEQKLNDRIVSVPRPEKRIVLDIEEFELAPVKKC